MTAIEFCGHINKLIARGLQLTDPKDTQRRGMFMTLQNRVNIVIGVGPEHLIEKLGPALYKFKDPIKNRDENFFMNMEIIPPPSLSKDSAEMLRNFSDSIRKMYREAAQVERDSVYKTIKTLLRLYVNYLLSKK